MFLIRIKESGGAYQKGDKAIAVWRGLGTKKARAVTSDGYAIPEKFVQVIKAL